MKKTKQESKRGRGGKRHGAGRKPGSINRKTALRSSLNSLKDIKGGAAQKAVSAAGVLGVIDELGMWLDLLSAADKRLAFDALRYLTDRRDGRPRVSLEHSGPHGSPLGDPPCIMVRFVESNGNGERSPSMEAESIAASESTSA